MLSASLVRWLVTYIWRIAAGDTETNDIWVRKLKLHDDNNTPVRMSEPGKKCFLLKLRSLGIKFEVVGMPRKDFKPHSITFRCYSQMQTQ